MGINFHELPCFCYGSILTSLLQLGINKFVYKVVDKLATNLLRTNLLQPCHNKLNCCKFVNYESCYKSVSTSLERAVQPVDKLLELHCYKSAAGLLQLVSTNLQQTCSKAVATTCQHDVFALLTPSLLTT